MNKTIIKIMSLMLVVFLWTSSNTPIFAVQNIPISDADKAKIEANEMKAKQHQRAIEVLTPYVYRQDDGTFKLEAPQDIIDSIDQETFNVILYGSAMVNDYIKQGKLSSKGLTVYDPSVTDFCVQGNLNQVVWQWWGVQIYLNNTNTQRLIALVAGGSGVSTIAAAIAGMVPGGQLVSGALWIVTGIIIIGAAGLMYYAAPGQGIVINAVYTPPPIPPYIYIQSQY